MKKAYTSADIESDHNPHRNTQIQRKTGYK